jgi:hypothetical protein
MKMSKIKNWILIFLSEVEENSFDLLDDIGNIILSFEIVLLKIDRIFRRKRSNNMRLKLKDII